MSASRFDHRVSTVQHGLDRALLAATVVLAACGASGEHDRAGSIGPTRASDGPREPPANQAEPAASAKVISAVSSSPAPESGEPATEELDVPGFGPAVVVVPPGEAPAKLVFVAHGAGGRPEVDCARYLALTRGRAFLLCLRGRPMNAFRPPGERGYFYDGHPELGREVRAASKALVLRHGARVDLEDATYAGYSQGASMGVLYLQQGGAREAHVTRILLVEGGAATWNIATAAGLLRDGVKKVAIVCGQPRCRDDAERSLGWIRRSGLAAHLEVAPGAGHTSDGSVRAHVDAAWDWLFGDGVESPRAP